MVLGKWKMVMVVPHTHIFVMAGLHVKRPMFYPCDWDLAFYGILHMYGVHFKQPMFYIMEWVWWYTIIYKNGVRMLSN
jgi:hypothetical protein